MQNRRNWASGLICVALALLAACTAADRRLEMTVLIRMIDQQDRWFRRQMELFADREGVRLNVVTFNSIIDVQRMLSLDAQSGRGQIGLVKTHKEMISPLVKQGLMLPLDEVFGSDQLQRDLEDYLPIAVEVGFQGDRCYYLPRKLETFTLLFLRSRVQEAVENWKSKEEEISDLFRQTTTEGRGLPPDYQLEPDPNRWDWYDLAVVSHYWAATPYGGRKGARMAHRGRKYSGTMTELAAKVFQAGGRSEDLLTVAAPAVSEAFAWEAFFRKNGLYNAGMWEQRWGGGEIWKGMSNGLVFLAFMHQLDAFFIHGITELEGYLIEPDEMMTAIMPRAASFSNSQEAPFGHYSQKSGWWWGVPRSSPDPALSYRLIRHITSDEFHREEVRRFGMMPVTKKVFDELDTMFSAPEQRWMDQVFRTAKLQFGIEAAEQVESPVGVRELPEHPAWPSIQEIWLEAWYDIVVDGNYSEEGPDGKVDRDFIARRLEPYRRRIQELAERGGEENRQ